MLCKIHTQKFACNLKFVLQKTGTWMSKFEKSYSNLHGKLTGGNWLDFEVWRQLLGNYFGRFWNWSGQIFSLYKFVLFLKRYQKLSKNFIIVLQKSESKWFSQLKVVLKERRSTFFARLNRYESISLQKNKPIWLINNSPLCDTLNLIYTLLESYV